MSRSVQNPSRRLFLQQSAALSALGAASPFALNLAAVGSASAQSASGYKALVCIYLAGGNDAYNTVLATDSNSWTAYQATRGQSGSSISLAAGSVLSLSPTNNLGGRTLGLHPQLSGLQNLFNNQRRLAIVSNVGPLMEPLSKDEYNRKLKRTPSKLFSHNDQQSTWQALAPEGAAYGWGGRLADIVGASNGNSLFTGISAAGNAVWLSGQNVKQYQLQSTGALRMGVAIAPDGKDRLFGSDKAAVALQRIAGSTRTATAFDADIAEVNRRSIQADGILNAAMPSASLSTFGSGNSLYYTKPEGSLAINPLAQQLQVVARTIAARDNLGMKRQVFFVSLGGFDTHDGQVSRHADLMARLNHAMVYFDNVINAMGLSNDVTTFTASDFGRTFTSNGDGTDHGWGGHHFVMGGAVQGGAVVGEVPTYSYKNTHNNDFDGSTDQITNGALLPKISVEQYGGALGEWFGAGSAISSIFPNIANFRGNLNLMRT